MDFTNLGALLFTYTGRVNRGRYWSAVVIYILVMILLVAAGFIIVGNSLLEIGDEDASDIAAGLASKGIGYVLIVIAVYIPLVISGVMVGIKRLHDRDKSGLWLLVFYAGPTVLGMANLGTIGTLASFAVSIWGLVELGFLRGTAGPNKYGPDPIAAQ